LVSIDDINGIKVRSYNSRCAVVEIEVNLALGCWREGWSANRSSFGVEIEPTFAASAASVWATFAWSAEP